MMVAMDLSGVFTPSQAYVALSRVEDMAQVSCPHAAPLAGVQVPVPHADPGLAVLRHVLGQCLEDLGIDLLDKYV